MTLPITYALLRQWNFRNEFRSISTKKNRVNAKVTDRQRDIVEGEIVFDFQIVTNMLLELCQFVSIVLAIIFAMID